MKLEVGTKIPVETFPILKDGAPDSVDLKDKLQGRKVVIFGLPGAFTGTCSTKHLPSFIEAKDEFAAKGVDEIICVAVNDVFVMDVWADQTGAKDAGITMLPDPESKFTSAIGMDFDVPELGFVKRSNRYAMLVEDGVVTALQVDEAGQCDLSTGNSFLAAI
ncbi:peroxiredoxin [Halocynthiibacter sp. C4]|uniref:peroxiredoxin n=1 Tax=Halocynthiibacter sp. C4 TaxID=2992758 RepID=UPI00237B2ED2|nr:peroxiredoxin [Halocynthiibacter sp. C4]MDE0588399.1 peroxiredoxin [Halocynthiibacter sp. C4]